MAGENRFMPPREPEPWEGIRPAVFWGDTAPQKTKGKYQQLQHACRPLELLIDKPLRLPMLNIWTPDWTDNKKRPVLVWLHGGGFTNGNGIEQDGYNGENISRCEIHRSYRYPSIIVCSLSVFRSSVMVRDSKHRAMWVFSTRSPGLKWHNNNIGNLAGDPDNVTIIGQSAVVPKCVLLLLCPKRKGFIHNTIALSGNSTDAIDKNYSAAVGKAHLAGSRLEAFPPVHYPDAVARLYWS